MNGSGISWAICKSAPSPRQTTTPAPHHSVFLQAGCPSCHQTNSVKALKAITDLLSYYSVIYLTVLKKPNWNCVSSCKRGLCWCADGFHVPNIQPLETLHNALTLRQVEHFIKNVTDMHCRTAPLCITPSTPPQSQQPTQLSLHPAHLAVPSVNQLRGTSCMFLVGFSLSVFRVC